MPDGTRINKWILREAYRGVLPDAIVDRQKVVLSEGAGLGDNSSQGPFFRYAHLMMPEGELRAMQHKHPAFALRDAEEALYFSIFRAFFGEVPMTAERLHVNRLPTRA
jgi:hypothetical protein